MGGTCTWRLPVGAVTRLILFVRKCCRRSMDVFLSVGWVSDRFPPCTLAKSFDRWRSHSPSGRTACFPKLISEPHLETGLKEKQPLFNVTSRGKAPALRIRKLGSCLTLWGGSPPHRWREKELNSLLVEAIHPSSQLCQWRLKKWHLNSFFSCFFFFLVGKKNPMSDNLQLVQELLFIGRQTITQHKDPAFSGILVKRSADWQGKRSWLCSQLEGENYFLQITRMRQWGNTVCSQRVEY